MIYIWGAGKRGTLFCRYIKKYLNCDDEVAFCDNAENKIGLDIEGAPVIDWRFLNKKKDILKESMFIVAVADNDKESVEEQLKRIGAYDNIYYIDEIEKFIGEFEQFVGKPVIPYIETHLSDHCNLKCKGCGHLSNIAHPKFADYEKFVQDLDRLRELFSRVGEIRLMGGEPFLNPHWIDFAKAVRNKNPDTDIRIVTNGLLLCAESGDLIKQIADLDIQLDISGYFPTMRHKKEIISILEQYNICYQLTENIEKFMRFRNPNANMDIQSAFNRCPIKSCNFLREGKISICSFPILYSQLETFMKEKFHICTDDMIDIYRPEIGGWEIIWKLTHAIPACRYCRTDAIEFFSWERTAETEAFCNDWFVEV